MYQLLFRLILSRMDPEDAHHLAVRILRWWPVPARRPAPELAVRTLGLHFSTPFGLAAGFDKDARAIRGLGRLGFGHVEVGTITAHPQPGNPRPRVFRLVPDRAVINRMGFNNRGAAATAPRLRSARRARQRPIIGVNIGKSRITPVEAAIDDYRASTRLLAPHADYLVVNVSSPNTPGLRGLQELDQLEPLLREVRDEAGAVPVLVKISPDMDDEQVAAVSVLAARLGLAGIVATNTTIRREGLRTDPDEVAAAGEGGLSGAPLAVRALEVLRAVRAAVPAPEFCVISVGGVTTAADVRARLDAGATLVQGFTAFVYEGPFWARRITRELVRRGTPHA